MDNPSIVTCSASLLNFKLSSLKVSCTLLFLGISNLNSSDNDHKNHPRFGEFSYGLLRNEKAVRSSGLHMNRADTVKCRQNIGCVIWPTVWRQTDRFVERLTVWVSVCLRALALKQLWSCWPVETTFMTQTYDTISEEKGYMSEGVWRKTEPNQWLPIIWRKIPSNYMAVLSLQSKENHLKKKTRSQVKYLFKVENNN